MDFLYGHERKYGDFEDPDMTDMLEPDMFGASMAMDEPFGMPLPPALTETDHDWFQSIFDEAGLVYNDKNLGEAATQPCIKSEHSYSTNSLNPSSPIILDKMEESDTSFFPGGGTIGSAVDLTQKQPQLMQTSASASAACQPAPLKAETGDMEPFFSAMLHGGDAAATAFAPAPATIILATTSTSTASTTVLRSSVQGVQVKTEPLDAYDMEQAASLDLGTMPPTPPSSAGSDSDGSQSPQRSAPNSPQHHSSLSQSGVLILTEEEKRTLISEGYPVPTKLPLSKQEEKNLKKVRRKIKNKISAQESRRKKKEYLEALEKRVEAFNHENCDLKKKVECLESNNRSLLSQLHKLQALVTKVPRSAAAASATQTGTVLMVLVLCFAVFLGGSGFGTSSLNLGYSGGGPASLSAHQPWAPRPQPSMGPSPARVKDTADDYTTPSLKSSRVLMALSGEDTDDWCDEYRPLVPWARDRSCSVDMDPNPQPPAHKGPAEPGPEDVLPKVKTAAPEGTAKESVAVVTVALGSDHNRTGSEGEDYQASMHPDIAVAPPLSKMANFTGAEMETA